MCILFKNNIKTGLVILFLGLTTVFFWSCTKENMDVTELIEEQEIVPDVDWVQSFNNDCCFLSVYNNITQEELINYQDSLFLNIETFGPTYFFNLGNQKEGIEMVWISENIGIGEIWNPFMDIFYNNGIDTIYLLDVSIFINEIGGAGELVLGTIIGEQYASSAHEQSLGLVSCEFSAILK